MKIIRSLATVELLLAVVGSICLFSGVAKAQTVKGKFQLTEQATWNGAVLPAGEYTVTVDSPMRPICARLQDADGKVIAMLASSDVDDAKGSRSYLFITRQDGQRKIRTFNLPEYGVSVTFDPLTKAERHDLDVAAENSIPVVMAKK